MARCCMKNVQWMCIFRISFFFKVRETSLTNLPLSKLYKVSLEGKYKDGTRGISMTFNLLTGALKASEYY